MQRPPPPADGLVIESVPRPTPAEAMLYELVALMALPAPVMPRKNRPEMFDVAPTEIVVPELERPSLLMNTGAELTEAPLTVMPFVNVTVRPLLKTSVAGALIVKDAKVGETLDPLSIWYSE